MLIANTVSICLIPGSRDVLGKAAYLGAIATVFAYPGRRFGQLIEALILAISGMILGLAWSLLGLYLSSLVIRVHAPAAYSIRGVFLACALLLHGFLRSTTPRLFTFVLLLVIVAVVTLTSVATAVTPISATQIVYPILVAGGVILVVNLLIFPEFSASFLGDTTIRTLHETTESLRNAGFYFTETLNSTREPACSVIQKPERKAQTDNEHTRRPDQSRFASKVFMSLLSLEGGGNPSNAKMSRPQPTTLQELVGAKAGLRANLARCKEAQRECNFELAFAVLPPRDLKPIGSDSMKRFVANTIAVIGACESKFALLGEGNERVNRMPEGADRKPSDSASGHYAVNYINGRRETVPSGPILGGGQAKLDLIKPMREIEFGDVRLLQHLLARIAAPYTNLRTVMLGASDCVMVAIACTYNVTKLPSGAKTPKGLSIEEVDRNTDELSQALTTFDGDIAAALEGAVDLQESKKEEAGIMPREEVFLVASFLLNLRQAASHVEDMLRHSRALVLQHRSRHGRRRFYAPRIKWSKWLYSGGEEEEALPASGRKGNREGEENVQADDEDDADPLEPKEYPINSTDREKDLENGRNTGISPPKLAGPYSGFTAKSSAGASTIHSNQSQSLRIRGSLANGVEWAQNSEDLRYAFKLTVAVMLVTWPAFVARWNTWYSLNRGCE